MNTNTNALRAVEEIDDELEVATREYEQAEKERDEVDAKLRHLVDVKEEVDGVVAGGDHRKIDDDLLDRGGKAERGAAALVVARAKAEAKRRAAGERCGEIRRARRIEELRDRIEPAAARGLTVSREAVAVALTVFQDAMVEYAARRRALAAVRAELEGLAGGVPFGNEPSGRELLAGLGAGSRAAVLPGFELLPVPVKSASLS